MCSIFQELQIVHETGYFSALPSLEEYWQQVTSGAELGAGPLGFSRALSFFFSSFFLFSWLGYISLKFE